MLATRQIGSSTVCRRSCSSTAFSHAAHQRNRTTGCCERRSSSPLHTTSQQVLLAPCSQSQLSQQQQHQQQQQQALACRATINSESAANQEWALQMSPAAADELERDRQWISSMIRDWLDEEWTPLGVHAQLGEAAGAAYITCRLQGDDDMSSLVLGMANELLAFNYRETFVNGFEVANKVVEQLMVRGGIGVCCTTGTEPSSSSGGGAQSCSGSVDCSTEAPQ